MDAIELKLKFSLECEWGATTFYISHDVEKDGYEIRCSNCGRVIGVISRYGVDWIEKEKKDVVSSD